MISLANRGEHATIEDFTLRADITTSTSAHVKQQVLGCPGIRVFLNRRGSCVDRQLRCCTRAATVFSCTVVVYDVCSPSVNVGFPFPSREDALFCPGTHIVTPVHQRAFGHLSLPCPRVIRVGRYCSPFVERTAPRAWPRLAAAPTGTTACLDNGSFLLPNSDDAPDDSRTSQCHRDDAGASMGGVGGFAMPALFSRSA